MVEVLSGFSIIWMIILVGYIVGRTGILGPEGQPVLSRLTFFVASPALLFKTLSEGDPSQILGPQLWVAAFSAFVVMGLFLVAAKFMLLPRSASEKIIAALSAGQVNSANLGLPIAAYVLGSAAWAAPVILFQLAILTPIYVFVLDIATDREDPTITRVRRGFWGTTGYMVLTVIRNPMIIGSLAGLIFAITGWSLWEPIDEAVTRISGAAVPAMLMAFGISLVGSQPLNKESGRRRDVLVASIFKLAVHPVIAWLMAAFVFRLDPAGTLAATVMASLPSAQNVFVAAARYNTGIIVAKDTILVTTIAAIPAMTVVGILLA